MDYSLVIMETVEKKETTPVAPRWSFPPPICNSRSLFRCFCVSVALLPENVGGLFLKAVLGQNGVGGAKIDGNGAPRAKRGGPTRPGTWAAWAHSSGPSGLLLFASFAPRSCSFQKMMLVNFQVIWTSFGSLKHQNIENRVFCLCRVNSRKIGKQ